MSESTGAGNGAKEGLRGTAADARAAAGDRMRDAQEGARHAAEDARRRAGAEAERGKNRGAAEVHAWASALERAARELGAETAQGRLMLGASERIDELARSIEERSVGDMVAGVADFGRRNPVAFAGGALLAGFALSRFATASRPDSHEDEEDMR